MKLQKAIDQDTALPLLTCASGPVKICKSVFTPMKRRFGKVLMKPLHLISHKTMTATMFLAMPQPSISPWQQIHAAKQVISLSSQSSNCRVEVSRKNNI